MASTLNITTSFEDTRRTRLPSLDHAASARSIVNFGSTFGMSGNAWGNSGSIWSMARHQSDGSPGSDNNLQFHDQNNTPGRLGSKPLHPFSDNNPAASRPNNPWSDPIRSNAPDAGRIQMPFISPIRLQSENTVTERQYPLPSMSPQHLYEKYTGSRGDHRAANLGVVKTLSIPKSGKGPLETPAFNELSPMNRHINSREFSRRIAFGQNSNVCTSIQDLSRQSDADTPTPPSTNRGSSLQTSLDDKEGGSYPELSLQLHTGNIHRSQNMEYGYMHDNLARSSDFGNGTPFHENIYEDLPRECDLRNMPSMFGRLNVEHTVGRNGKPSQLHTGCVPGRFTTPGSIAFVNAYGPNPGTLSHEDIPFVSKGGKQGSSNLHSHPFIPRYLEGHSSGAPDIGSPTNGVGSGFHTPFYPDDITPPTGPSSMRSFSNNGLCSNTSTEYIPPYGRNVNIPDPFQQEPLSIHTNNSSQTQRHQRFSQNTEFSAYASTGRMNPLASPYNFSSHENDSSQIYRSPLLEDFRTNSKTNKRYELRDIHDHVVEFSGDQHGSRFIQQKLETANSDEKDQIFAEIQPNSLQLMTDVFGNYVVQKLFEHGNQSQKKVLANQMRGHVLSLSTQMYGCRVVQKALEHILTDQQASMVRELESHVLKCVKDQNGNHVIQKAIERVPAQHIQFIIAAFTDQVNRLATHPYGCRVIQRMLEHCEEPAKQSILRELHACIPQLITDQFGNYVIQHVIENGTAEDRYMIVAVVQVQLLHFSKHKFASNVVEKSIQFAAEVQRADILQQLTLPNERGDSPVLGLMRDQYGNYVLQKVLAELKGKARDALLEEMKANLIHLKKFSYGKQIMAIEKIIFENQQYGPLGRNGAYQHTYNHPGVLLNDCIRPAIVHDFPTTSLSTSSESSALPSTAPSTVDGPITPPYVSNLSKSVHETQIALPFIPQHPRH